MDSEEFKKFAKEAIDYIVDYNENVRERYVLLKDLTYFNYNLFSKN